MKSFVFVVLAAAAFSSSAAAGEVAWQTDAPTALRQAAASSTPVLVKFTADWCVYCKRMEQTTFRDDRVSARVAAEYLPVLVDADRYPGLMQKFGVKRLPAIVLLNAEQQVAGRITGYQTADAFLTKLPRMAVPAAGTVRMAAQPTAQPAPTVPVALTRDAGTPTASAAQTAPAEAAAPSFGGACLVTAVDQHQLLPGNPTFAARVAGQLVYFHSEEARKAFQKSPERYWPALGGNCAATLLESGRLVHGKLEFAASYEDRIWLFSTEARMNEFIAEPARTAAAAAAASRMRQRQ